MKIVCDSCQAKYSISDDKVQGKVFKIRCKKCSNIIVVRGGAGAAEAAPATQEKDTRVYDYGYDGGDAPPGGDEAVWHLVINQDQVGPMTASEVQQRFAAGEVDGETFTWREGFADWLPLAQVDAFAALVASGSTTAALPPGGGGAAAVSAMFSGGDDGGTTRSDPGDLFAASSGAARHHDDDGGDLFGSKPASGGGGGGGDAAAQKLRGERNENSVLFSLNNLAQLASDKPAPSASVVSAPSGHATGAAGGEGSGLIDIRSMASAYLGGSGAAPGKPATSAGIGSIDDLPVFGGGGFSEPAVIVPTARAAANNKLLYGMLAAVGGLALVAIILVVVLVRGSKKTVVVAANDKTAAAADKPEASADKPDTSASAATPAAGSAEAAAPAAGSAEAAQPAGAAATPAAPAQPEAHAEPAHDEHHGAAHATHHEVVASHETHHETAHVEHAAPAAPSGGGDSGGGGCDEVSCVLNSYAGACCAKFKKGGGGGGGGGGHVDSNLPEQLDASMVGSGLGSVRGRVSACGNRSSAKGAVKVHVKVGGNGRVESVSLLSSPDSGLGSCVQSAVQHASFPKTQRGGSFNYPFVF